jgi:hypothetical protein
MLNHSYSDSSVAAPMLSAVAGETAPASDAPWSGIRHPGLSPAGSGAWTAIVSPEITRFDRQAVWRKSFRPDVRRWIAQYSSVGQRDLYLWQWCLHGIELTTLPCVPPALLHKLHDTKLLSVILCVLFDDVADCGERAEWLSTLLETCGERGVSGLPSGTEPSECSALELQHRNVVRELWQIYIERVSQLEHFEELEPIWRFDLGQFFNSMRYGHLANRFPALINPAEHDVYSPHNMLMMTFLTLDLMASPPLPEQELGALREAIWHAQAMGRIGNVLSTWKREIRDRDFTGGIFSLALQQGTLSTAELQHLPGVELEARIMQAGYEAQLLARWETHRAILQRAASRVQSMDMQAVLTGHDRFLQMHLQSTGQI